MLSWVDRCFCVKERLGLDVDSGAAIFGFVGRMDHQKGADIVLGAASSLFCPPDPSTTPVGRSREGGPNIQLAVLGCGDTTLEAGISALQVRAVPYWPYLVHFQKMLTLVSIQCTYAGPYFSDHGNWELGRLVLARF